MSQLVTQAAITFQPTDLRIHKQAGEQWLVAPLVAVRAMQINGEHLTSDELEASVEAWGQAIVTLGHPHLDGQNVSVKQAPWFAAGYFASPTFSDNKLRGEAWLPMGVRADIDGLVERMQSGEGFDVSTGYFATVVEREGQRYQTDIEPDHIAILLNERGACSWQDGCGIPRVNQEQASDCMCQEQSQGEQSMPDEVKQNEADEQEQDVEQEAQQEEEREVEQSEAEPQAAEPTANTQANGSASVKQKASKQPERKRPKANSEEPEADNAPVAELDAQVVAFQALLNEFGGVGGLRDLLSGIKANADQERADLISEIKSNSQNFDDDDLAAMSTDLLEKIAASVRPASYAGRSAGQPVANSEDEWVDYEPPKAE